MFQRMVCKAVIALLLVLPAVAGAGERFVRPVLSCPPVQAKPVIDGRLDEPAWLTATRVTNFRSSYGDRQAVEQTEVYLCRDSERVYIAVRCHDSQMDKIVAKRTSRDDNIFWDDSVEIFIDPGLSRKHFMQFIVNPLGALLDLKITEITEMGWNANCQVAAAVGENAWTVELAIPFAELGLASPKPGQRWGVNVTRTTHRLKEYSCWSPTGSDRFQVPRRFGDMVFTAGSGLQATIGQVDPQTRQIELTFDGQKRPLKLEVNAVSSAGDSRSVAREIPSTDFGKPIRVQYLLSGGWEGFALNVVAREAVDERIVYRSPSIPIAASAEAKFEMARQEIYRLKADMMLLKASAGPAGYVLAPSRPFEPAMPSDFPDVTSVGQPIRVSACAGEYEPGSLLIYTSTDLKAVRVGLESDLKCAGNTIPREAVDIRILKRWFQGGPGQKYFKPVLAPELLLKNDALISVDYRAEINTINFDGIPSDGPVLAPFDVPAYSNKKVWLTVHVPRETSAGLYKGRLRVTPAGLASASIAVEVNVLPFELREAGKLYTVYYYSPRVYHYGESPEAFVNELEDMRAHGLTGAAVMSYDTEFSVNAEGAYQMNLDGPQGRYPGPC